ncbi:MAG: DNA-directed RNA polymerase subunit beta' [Proteobacteria bacterium]|uniref:DNA-directed RNA polymerase subunit beta' n=1 Tax=Candidatus Enterousia excrementavium TaxID=2840789 RepID=A0A940DF68_9PROT|nr:DNA-directed RNA polymerase subunit beta' [Candidatus Enterousia excrementavium]
MTNMLQKIFGQIETKEQFDALRITIASPEEILSWSHGEVKKPETINYHSMKPEPEGLFCQQIFGPIKDYECACGKYKRIKFRGVVCERCGVEVGSSTVRRERMGHIKLAMPVAHTWFLREGKIATLLNNLPQKKLEQVISYDAYIVIEPGLTSLKQYDVISEDEYQKAIEEFGADSFRVGIGAEGVRSIIANLDMGDERTRLRAELAETKSDAKRKGLIKQLKLVEAFLESKTEPAWMLPDIIPVIPPDMRPLVTLDAGHVAASDLNDLYRRVIIRNNRLKRFIEMHAPEIIVRNEKRMLQEAVDSLFDNGHKARPMVSQNRRPLKSLSDSLRGKSGRFRMNLLGKRVDYSGRSVIVSGPSLKLHQVGLPKAMALELFKPFVYSRLMTGGYANTLKTARKMVENGEDVVWEILEDVIHQHPVLLNRQPTLHRLSMLAFEPVLIEGKAIRLHPLVCKGFNADFDGDQMAVHVPISLEAQLEARTLMLSSNNVLSPANGEPMIVPSQDMVLGVYYISLINGEHTDKSPRFANMDEVKMALENKSITLHTPIVARINGKIYKTTAGRMILGELLPKSDNMPFDLVNKVMPVGEIKALLATTYERCGDKAMILLADALKDTGFEQAARSGISIGYDDIVIPSEKKQIIEETEKAAEEIEQQYQNGLLSGGEKHNKLIDLWQNTTDKIGDLAYAALEKNTGDKWNSVWMMAKSGARGSKRQIQQVAGMRGMMQKPDGSIIEVPIISNFKEGLTMAEYFTSTHGARKGMSDTALKTADAGYLTRRLVELSQNTVITEHDCGTDEYITAKPVYQGSTLSVPLGDVVLGRTAAHDIVHPITKEVIVPAGELVTKAAARKINESGLPSVDVRSVLTCHSDGLCAKCYGMDLSRQALVHVGEAVGVIAGQSIGEPGTQLTLRTFHIGGVASGGAESHYIEVPVSGTVKLSGVNTIKNSAGRVVVLSRNGELSIVDAKGENLYTTKLPYASMLIVNDGDTVEKGAKVAEWDPYSNTIIAEKDGIVQFQDLIENVSYQEEVDSTTGITSRKVINWKANTKKALNPAITLVDEKGQVISLGGKKVAEYLLPMYSILNVANGATVSAGDVLARIPVQTKRTGDITGGLPRVNELLEVRRPSNPALLAEIDGTIELEDAKSKIIVRIMPDDGTAPVEYAVPKGTNLLVRSGDIVRKADKLVDGDPVPQDILRILGRKALATFMVEQIQQVYRLQGVSINDKHIEILIREMTRRVEITNPGDTGFLMGAVVDRVDFEEENARVVHDGGRPAEASQVLVGLTRASLTSRSFISNASFQQTTKVLVDAAISGATDKLVGINENLIVGRLIPVGTGAYVRRVREIAKEEEKAEKLAREGNAQQQLLDI